MERELGMRGPARVAEAWAEQLGAHLDLLASRAVYTDADQVANLLAAFLN